MKGIHIALLLMVCSLAFGQDRSIGGRGGGGRGQGRPPGSLIGKVVDDRSGNPVEFATISLFRLRDSTVTGTTTIKNGTFVVENVRPGRYLGTISFIGYEAVKTDTLRFNPRRGVMNQDLGTIKLKPSAILLDAAEVVAERSFQTNEIDRKAYVVKDLGVSEGGSVVEVLEVIPSVDVDLDGNISLRGNENVTILIDGRPSNIIAENKADILEQFPASSIERIEVITNPSVKFDPEGVAGILNVITKKNKLEGLTGNVRVSAALRNKYNTSGSINYKAKKWSISANLGHMYREMWRRGETYREDIYTDSIVTLNQSSYGDNVRGSYRGGLGFEVYPNRNQTIYLNGNYGYGYRAGDEIVDYAQGERDSALADLWNRTTISDNWNHNAGGDIGWSWNFNGDVKNNLALDLSHSQQWTSTVSKFSDQHYDPVELDADPSATYQRNLSAGSNRTSRARLDYIRPVRKNMNIELGYQSMIRNTDTDFTGADRDSLGSFVVDTSISNHFVFNEEIHGGYFIFKHRFGKFGYQVGVRAEQAFVNSDLITTNQTFENNYFSLFPSGHISYQVTEEQQIKASYSRRINRPGSWHTNPFPRYSDPLNLRVGNPFLLPEYTDIAELEYGYTKKKFSLTVAGYFRFVDNMITHFRTVEDGISTSTFTNLNSSFSYGLDASVNARPFTWWTLIWSANLFVSKLNGDNVTAVLNQDAIGMNTKLLTTFKIPKIFDLQLSARYRAPQTIPQGRRAGVFSLDGTISKRILRDKGTVSFQVRDIFNTRRWQYQTEGDNFYNDGYRRRESRTFQLSFSYRFGELKDRSRGKRGNGGGRGGDNSDSMEEF